MLSRIRTGLVRHAYTFSQPPSVQSYQDTVAILEGRMLPEEIARRINDGRSYEIRMYPTKRYAEHSVEVRAIITLRNWHDCLEGEHCRDLPDSMETVLTEQGAIIKRNPHGQGKWRLTVIASDMEPVWETLEATWAARMAITEKSEYYGSLATLIEALMLGYGLGYAGFCQLANIPEDELHVLLYDNEPLTAQWIDRLVTLFGLPESWWFEQNIACMRRKDTHADGNASSV